MSDPIPFTDPMLSSARSLLSDATAAWASKDHGKVLMLAPIAAEHLCKSALWHRNPVLLAQLDSNHEKSFLSLATKPDPNDESLRTIGLATALARVARVHDVPPPLDGSRTRRLTECRGGAVHVGQFNAKNAELVLADVLTIFDWLSPLLGVSPQSLFGSSSETATRLLDRRRTSQQRAVDRRIAAAQARFQRLVESVGPDLLLETTAQKESLAKSHVSRLIEEAAVAADRHCPACNQMGILIGDLEADHDVDAEWTPDGTEYNVTTDYFLIPDSFYCHVCGLILNSADELAMCQLPASIFKLGDEEITPALVEYAQDREAWLRESADIAYDGS